MINRSEIMKAAWANYRASLRDAAASAYGHLMTISFAECLKDEWRRAKGAARKARLEADATYQRLTFNVEASLMHGNQAEAFRALNRYVKEFA